LSAAPSAIIIFLSSTLNVVELMIVVRPFTVKLPPIIVLPLMIVFAERIVVLPVAEPIFTLAAPPSSRVVAVVFAKLNVDWVDRISPPLTNKSPAITVFALLIVVLPVAAPIDTVVAAPPTFNVVAVVLNKFCTV